MLTALLVRGATLPGAAEGIRFYLEPKWEKVLDYQVITSVFRANAVTGRGCGLCILVLVICSPGNIVYCSPTNLLPNTFVCQLFVALLLIYKNLCHVMMMISVWLKLRERQRRYARETTNQPDFLSRSMHSGRADIYIYRSLHYIRCHFIFIFYI